MAQLTWRPLEAPNLSTSMDGMRLFGDTLNNALNSAQKGLDRFEGIQDNRVNQGAMAEIVAMQDPKTASAMVAALAQRPEAKRFNAATMAALMQRPGQLTTQAKDSLELTDMQNTFERGQKFQQIADQAQGAIREYYAAIQTGDEKLIQSKGATVFQALQGAPIEKVLPFMRGFTGDEQTRVGISGNRQTQYQSGVNFDNSQLDRKESREAAALAEEIRGAYGNNMDAAEGHLNGLFGKRSPQVLAAARGILGINTYRPYEDPLGGLGGLSGASIYGADGSLNFDALWGNLIGAESGGRQFDQNGKPLTSSAGAIGIAQVMPGTAPEAAKLAGLPWDENRYKTDPNYNAALGQAYLKKQLQTFGGNPALAAAAYNAGPGAVQAALKKGGMSNWIQFVPAETKAYVQKVTGGSDVAGQIIQSSVDALQNVGTAAGFVEGNAGSRLATKFFELAGSQESPREVALRLAKEDPSLDVNWLEGAIVKELSAVKNMGGKQRNAANAAIVGQAIKDNSGAQGAREFWGRLIPDAVAGNTIGKDMVYDPGATRASVKSYITGDLDATIATNNTRVQTNAAVATWTAAYQKAVQAYQNKAAGMRARGIRNPDLSQEALAVQIAQNNLNEALGMRGAPGNQANAGTNAAPQPAASGGTKTTTKQPAQAAQPTQQPARKAPELPPGPVNFDQLNKPLGSILEQRRQDTNEIRNRNSQRQREAQNRANAEKNAASNARLRQQATTAISNAVRGTPEERAAQQALIQQRRAAAAAARTGNQTLTPQRKAYLQNRIQETERQLKGPISAGQRTQLEMNLTRYRNELK